MAPQVGKTVSELKYIYTTNVCIHCHTNLTRKDLNLPRTMVQRLAKGVLPPNTQIQKDALLAISKSATVFVNYLTSQYLSPLPRTPFPY